MGLLSLIGRQSLSVVTVAFYMQWTNRLRKSLVLIKITAIRRQISLPRGQDSQQTSEVSL